MLEKGLFSILVQNSPKVTKKVLVFRKNARSYSLTEMLLKILKVAKQNLEREAYSYGRCQSWKVSSCERCPVIGGAQS